MMRNKEYKQKGMFVLARALNCCLLVAILAGPVACAFGDTENKLEESQSLLTYLLHSQQGDISLELRLGDGGTDRIDQFTSGGAAIALSTSSWIEVERVEVVLKPNALLASAAPATLACDGALDCVAEFVFDFFAALSPFQPLMAHGEDTVVSAGAERYDIATNLFLQPLSAGTTGNGSDLAGRRFFLSGVVAARLRPGTIENVLIHVKRIQMNGTINGATNFAVLHATSGDQGVVPVCGARVAYGSTTSLKLFVNFAGLFNNLPANTEAGVQSALATNLNSAALVSENDCFNF